VFIYGSAEEARMCIPTVERFMNTQIIVKKGSKHCRFLGEYPEEYTEVLVRIMSG
jgi:hypothetical protein